MTEQEMLEDLCRERDAWLQALKPIHDHYQRMWQEWDVQELLPTDASVTSNQFLSNERVHLPFQVVETMVPRIVGSEPRIEYRALDYDEDSPIADMMTGAANYQLRRMRFEQEFRDFVRQGEVTGYTVGKHGWNRIEEMVDGHVTTPHWDETAGMSLSIRETVSRRVATTNEGFFETVNVLDFVYPLNARRIQSCSAVWQRRWTTLGAVRRMGEAGQYRNVDKVKGGDGGEYSQTRLLMLDTTRARPATDPFDDDDDRASVVVWERWTNDRLVAIAGSTNSKPILLRDQPNPFKHRQKPFVDFTPVPHPFRMHGIGMVQLVYDTAHSLNTLRRQRRDAVTYTINPAWKGRGGINAKRVKLFPGFFLELSELEDIEPLTTPTIDFSSAQYEEQRMREDVQEATGAFTYLQGSPDSAGSTATEVATITSEGNKRIAEQIKQLNERCMIPLAQQLADNIAQWMDTDLVIRFTDLPDAARPAYEAFAQSVQEGSPEVTDPERHLIRVTPEQVKAKGELEPYPEIGQDAELNKVQKISNAIQLGNAYAPIFAIPGQQVINLGAWAEYLSRQLGMPRSQIEKIVNSGAPNPQPPPPPGTSGPSGPSGDSLPLGGVNGQPAVAGT